MDKVFAEENGVYEIDCTKALWATDEIHDVYHATGVMIRDADFLIEETEKMYLVEYKNANIYHAVNPGAFKPEDDRRLNGVVQKFYDSLHYIYLMGKMKPLRYVYVLEFPNGDRVIRKRLRNKMKQKLPFELQDKVGHGRKMIEGVDVVSIREWNDDKQYSKYPITKRHGESQ